MRRIIYLTTYLSILCLFVFTNTGCGRGSRSTPGSTPQSEVMASVLAATGGGHNWYIRPDSAKYGSGSGADWNNAWSGFNNIGSAACGDTVWIAGGTYTSSISVGVKCTATTVLNINRVLSSDAVPVAAAGWSPGFDSQVILNNGGINLGFGSYYTINGRVGSPTANNFGISVRCTNGAGGCDAVDGPTSGAVGTIDHVTLTYIELLGPSCVMAGNCGGGGASGLNLARSTTTMSYLLVDHSWFHQWGELIRTSNWVNCTIQYSYLSDTHNDGQQHEDIMYNYAQTNLTMKYNKIWGSPNDGIFFDFGGTNGFYFYGNTYYHSGGQLITFKGGYTAAVNIYYYNNVFENDGTFGDYQPGWLDFTGASSTSGEVANNVFENMYLVSKAPNANHNAYNLSGDSDGGTGSFYYTAGSQFVNESAGNPAAADFHLTMAGATAFQNGKTLAAPYNVDPDGNTRGANGHWYAGAYQYGSTGGGGGTTSPTPTPTPMPPTSPTPTPAPVATPTPTPPVNQVVANFDGLKVNSAPSLGYPAAGISWSGFWVTPANDTPADNTNAISTTSASRLTGTVNLPTGYTLLNLEASNGGNTTSTVTVNCVSGQNTTVSASVPAGKLVTITTNWNSSCSQISLTSSNGWGTDYDNFTFGSGAGAKTVTATPPASSDPVATTPTTQTDPVKKHRRRASDI